MPAADDTPDPRPYFCIPYWSAPLTPGGTWDTGKQRPLPKEVTSYLCESIHAGPYAPGEPLDLTVDVRNSGDGSATSMATVCVYWANPTVGFAHPNILAVTSVQVPPSRTAPVTVTTDTMSVVIPADAPPHVCLVVSVAGLQDPAETIVDPVQCQHWAQRNLLHATAAPRTPMFISFHAANPTPTAGTFTLRADPVTGPQAQQVADEYSVQALDMVVRKQLLDDAGAPLSGESERPTATLDLGPLEDRSFQLQVDLDQNIPTGSATVTALVLSGPSGTDADVGSLGVVLLPPDA